MELLTLHLLHKRQGEFFKTFPFKVNLKQNVMFNLKQNVFETSCIILFYERFMLKVLNWVYQSLTHEKVFEDMRRFREFVTLVRLRDFCMNNFF